MTYNLNKRKKEQEWNHADLEQMCQIYTDGEGAMKLHPFEKKKKHYETKHKKPKYKRSWKLCRHGTESFGSLPLLARVSKRQSFYNKQKKT